MPPIRGIYANVDVQAMQDNEVGIAKEFDARKAYVESVANRAAVAAE